MFRTSVLTLLVIALPVFAGDPVKPVNTLSPKEIQDGWLLLFDGETTMGWDVSAPAQSKTGPRDGRLDLSADNIKTLTTTTAWHDFELHFDYQCQGEKGANAVLQLIEAEGPHAGTKHLFVLPDTGGAFSHTKLGRQGDKIASRLLRTSTELEERRLVRISFDLGSASKLSFINVKLVPGSSKTLLVGKNLAGWRIFPDKKSKFTVMADGDLNVKDGPGDLQTDGKWADFVLQLECKSNGKHLNSGIFFRCLPDQYQQGYECQIRNEFTAQPKQSYSIENFDPETGKMIDKKTVASTAVDYGTGAIYRRVPARKEVSKDGEWFTLTLHAQGKHMATWVNGYQQVDWNDFRPAADNARKGRYLDAGHISIQGHDPTTDLSFRNFRIAELPR